MKWLGITLDIVNPNYSLTAIRVLSLDNQVELVQLADIVLLEQLLEMFEEKFDRVVIYDFHELGCWEGLMELNEVCNKYDMSFSFLKQDLHFNEKIEFVDPTSVI